MNSKQKFQFTIITFVIGLMIAVQFQTTKQPIVRDTRDAWELREDLKKEQELQAKILREIRTYDEQLKSYEAEQNNQQVLKDALNDLKKEAGLTEVTGRGLVLKVEPLFDESLIGEKLEAVSPDLLKRLVNELNSYDANEISIANQRVIATTVIRDINGRTKINDYWLTRFPFEIKVIAKDVDRLYNRMQVSNAMDDFAADNLRLIISEPLPEVTIPAYDQVVRVKNMSPVGQE
ncbi:DUF881 domain-containing protein [Metabacillus iocasae]|uniref:Uncharacterized protein YlxW (UPF0749 family) n=1 Tax=Priestia iocasae TaxID=2291674 RepID=A0ABS2QQQ1_9BACI|nr:DUF881 domain-containing protein [Metabacillus iocasae]MBM7701777.1 uncharacterized protein YlxW (UPF0749 family) [Metabacillus iocasae]